MEKNTEANKDIRGWEKVYNKAEGSTIQTKVQQLHCSSLLHTFTTHSSESLNFVNLPPSPFMFNDFFFFLMATEYNEMRQTTSPI